MSQQSPGSPGTCATAEAVSKLPSVVPPNSFTWSRLHELARAELAAVSVAYRVTSRTTDMEPWRLEREHLGLAAAERLLAELRVAGHQAQVTRTTEEVLPW